MSEVAPASLNRSLWKVYRAPKLPEAKAPLWLSGRGHPMRSHGHPLAALQRLEMSLGSGAPQPWMTKLLSVAGFRRSLVAVVFDGDLG